MILDSSYNYHANNMCQQVAPIIISEKSGEVAEGVHWLASHLTMWPGRWPLFIAAKDLDRREMEEETATAEYKMPVFFYPVGASADAVVLISSQLHE